jgi:hypothetical protein
MDARTEISRGTLICANYQPRTREAELVERAFRQGAKRGANLSESGDNSEDPKSTGSRQFHLSGAP